MTSRELTSGFDFWSRGHLRMAVMHLHIKFGADIFIQSRVIDIFPKLKMAAAAIFGICVLCRIWFKYLLLSLRSTHICFKRSFDDVTRITFRFRILVTWSSPRRRGASYQIIWCKISLSCPKLLTFFRNSKWRPPPSWMFSLYEFGHSSVLAVWYLCSVPNLVQISVVVTEIDAHMLQTFIWWRHAN